MRIKDIVTGEWKETPPEQQKRDERTALMQTVAGLTIENADLKQQVQTLAQAVAIMQLGGGA